MKTNKISHLGIAVPSIDDVIDVYRETFGMTFTGTEEVASQKVKVAFLQVGESRLELLEPTGDDSPVAKYLNKNGGKPRFHHMALEVDDVQQALDDAKAAGMELIDETPRAGAGGASIGFVHPKSTAGVLTELCTHKKPEQ